MSFNYYTSCGLSGSCRRLNRRGEGYLQEVAAVGPQQCLLLSHHGSASRSGEPGNEVTASVAGSGVLALQAHIPCQYFLCCQSWAHFAGAVVRCCRARIEGGDHLECDAQTFLALKRYSAHISHTVKGLVLATL